MKETIRIRFFSFAALVFLSAAVITGCGGREKGLEFLEKPAVRVGDAEIALRELYAEYEAYRNALKAAGADIPQTYDEIDAALDRILARLVEERVETDQAKKRGYADFDREAELEFEARFQSRKQQILAYFTAEAESMKNMAANLDVDAYVTSAIGQMAIESGLNVASLEDYWALLREQTRSDYAVSRMREAEKTKIEPREPAVRAVYERILSENKARLKKGAGEYKSMEELYARYGGDPVFEIPEGYLRVFHVRAGTIEEAEEARRRLKSGEAFETVARKLSLDAVELDCREWAERGKPLSRFESALDWPLAVKEAALALKAIGDVTDVIDDGDNYYVCMLASRVPAGTVPYGEAEAVCREIAQAEAFEAQWEKKILNWSHNILYVHYYEQNIKILKTGYLK